MELPSLSRHTTILQTGLWMISLLKVTALALLVGHEAIEVLDLERDRAAGGDPGITHQFIRVIATTMAVNTTVPAHTRITTSRSSG